MTAIEDLHALFDAQRTAYLQEGPPPADVRRNRLDRLLTAVLGAADELAEALDADFGQRPATFSLFVDVASAIGNINHLREHLEEWMAPTDVPGSEAAGLPTTIDVTPLGVVGVVGPWNFPVSLVVQPAAEAIAAGNRVMIKFSDVDTLAGAVLARAVAAEFDPTELVVVNGGLDIATAFSSLPFNHLFFTGSPAVGKIVQRAAADNLTPVTLELGGKNPVVIGHDADLGFAAERVAGSRMVNGGQVCLCPDYVFVPRAKVDDFVAHTKAAFLDLFPDYLTNPATTSIVNDKNFERVNGLVRDAVAKGATAVLGVSDADAARLPDPAGRRIAPTLLLGVTEDMTVAQDEVFGPVLTVYPYDEVTEPIDYVNAHPSPLAAYWYGDDTEDFRTFRRRTASGGVTRNDFAVHLSLPDVPFGGVGQSGMGSYHGRAGFDTFSHRRAVAASNIPGGSVAMLGPATVANPAVAEGVRAKIAEARQEALRRLGR
ncbi:coniferyl-aldehyde dehydrogenase [Actinoplanes tereljensis]|uniref:Aldehyde dehydrogenase n=1 Tax=Paractinoplanes tereljensis TaxID=571912 RepID=A0A919P0K9_9ACTN|nr:aldehyde dehydrogenase family protein [Actinoplanes tereljensis]GIF26712.1 aldehyde dehydrogenase [Actinoplanes tereljensis]